MIHSGVVGMVESDEDVGVVLARELSENLVERGGAEFGGAASGLDRGGQADGFSLWHEQIVEEITGW